MYLDFIKMKKQSIILEKLYKSYNNMSSFNVQNGLNYVKKGAFLLEFGATFCPYKKTLLNLDDVCAYVNNETIEMTFEEVEDLKCFITEKIIDQ